MNTDALAGRIPIVRADVFLMKTKPGQLLGWIAGVLARHLNLRGGVWLAMVAVGLYGTLAAVPGSVAMLRITCFEFPCGRGD